ncbi:hypothetical protein H9L12_03295 [Sphingomonas rhizophila]|uniref:Uncharacterized protein n=1 Tax=Sphingomonas rhizophila TaxID=2071607 RepID=A0A7G9SCN8_9SPHN|nr:hypothetical protein [Sphingomonas rhizophila]QNN65613.1 hypothetical protein H9L12_03295 [Sphingomonas rhizophila]
MQSIRDIKLIRLSDRNRWFAGVAAAALLAGVGGLLIGRSMTDQPVATEQTEEAEGEEHGPEGFIAMTRRSSPRAVSPASRSCSALSCRKLSLRRRSRPHPKARLC